MAQVTIISLHNAPAIVLPAIALEGTGLTIGDTVELTVNGRAVDLAPAEDASRKEKVEQLTDEIIERRRDAYERLA